MVLAMCVCVCVCKSQWHNWNALIGAASLDVYTLAKRWFDWVVERFVWNVNGTDKRVCGGGTDLVSVVPGKFVVVAIDSAIHCGCEDWGPQFEVKLFVELEETKNKKYFKFQDFYSSTNTKLEKVADLLIDFREIYSKRQF